MGRVIQQVIHSASQETTAAAPTSMYAVVEWLPREETGGPTARDKGNNSPGTALIQHTSALIRSTHAKSRPFITNVD